MKHKSNYGGVQLSFVGVIISAIKLFSGLCHVLTDQTFSCAFVQSHWKKQIIALVLIDVSVGLFCIALQIFLCSRVNSAFQTKRS